ncbi:hypothetical protein LCGC14_0373420 [marine sediment metagenome]|uniref:Uncharacterized protein n=1 Tax=marine sediment metagenome TaxID=412755 RepID=A0A0F9TMI1_9ZZZZ
MTLSDSGLRNARQAYDYLSLGFAAEIEKHLGLVVEGIEVVREITDYEKNVRRVLLTSRR